MMMELDAAREMIGALALICLLAVGYGKIRRRLDASGRGTALLGCLFGVMAMLEMLDPVTLMPGVIADLRSLPLALAAGFLGLRGLLPALAIACATRASLGGIGAESGIVGMMLVGTGGLLWHNLFGRKPQRHAGHLLLLGGLTAASLVGSFVMPFDIAVGFLIHMGPTLAALNILGILVAGSLMEREHRLALENLHLREQAVIDPITGFLNQLGFRRALGRATNDGSASRGFAGLLFEIEHLKWLSDTWGPDALGHVTRTFPARIEPHLRRGDTCANLGKGRIAIFLPDISQLEAEAIAAQIQRDIADAGFPLGTDGNVRVNGHVGLCWTRVAQRPSCWMPCMEKALSLATANLDTRIATYLPPWDQDGSLDAPALFGVAENTRRRCA